MLLLLDENLPKRLKSDFSEHKVFTIKERGWNGLKNGLLLQKLIENNFDALITFDKNLQHQQNFKKYPITVIVLSARINKYSVLMKLTPQILDILRKPLIAGPIEVK
ncbi:MAG: DUF5615 family PIN-like protein [Saprospiraceae bacterium]